MTNWANRGKASVGAIPLTKTNAVDRGTRRTGIVESFTPKAYKTGSFGIEVKYTVDGLERPVYENIVLTLAPKGGKVEATKYGLASLKRRLQAFGLDAEAVNAFPIPESPKDESEAYNFQGTPVIVYTKEEEYLGRIQHRVGSVFGLDS